MPVTVPPVVPAEAGLATAVPVVARVVPGPLAGLAPSGPAQAFATPAATIGALDSDQPEADLAALRREGFIGSAIRRYGDGEVTVGMSFVVQVGSPRAARDELARQARQIRVQAGPAGRSGVRHLRRIPGSVGFSEDFSESGKRIRFAGVVFADGPFFYILTAGGPVARIDPRRVFDASAALYRAVHGHPPA